MRLWNAAVLLVISASLMGCGRQEIYPVKGKLIYPDGTPARELKGSRVISEGSSISGKIYSAQGEIDGEGAFQLATLKAGDGSIVGKNKVLIERRMIDPEHVSPRVIHERFERFETSGLELDVGETTNEFTLTVEPIERTR